MIWLWDILNVLYSGHCYVKYVGGGRDIFLWGTKCSRQRYSAVGLMTGMGPQLPSRSRAVFKRRLKCRPWDCVWHSTPLSETYLYSKWALDYSLKWQMRAPIYFVVAGLTKRSPTDCVSLSISNTSASETETKWCSWSHSILFPEGTTSFWVTTSAGFGAL